MALNQQAKIASTRSNVEEPRAAAGIGKQARASCLLRIPGKGSSRSWAIFGEAHMDRTKRIVRQFGILRQFAIALRYSRIAIQTLRANGTIMHDSRHLIGR